MENKHLEVFEELKKQLLNFPRDTLYDKYLDAIVSAQLKKIKYSDDGFEPEKLSRQYVYAKAKDVSEDAVDSQTAKNSIKTAKLNLELDRFIKSQPDCIQAFDSIGYMPIVIASSSGGGAKNRALLWMDIQSIRSANVEQDDIEEGSLSKLDENDDDDEDLSSVTYERKVASDIKPSLFTRIFFKQGELKVLSARGLFLMLLLILSFIVDIFIGVFAFFVILLMNEIPNLKLWQAMLYAIFVPVAYLNWRYFFMPLYSLPVRRVIKAPMFFANINVVNADIEMYRGKDKLNIARITEFTATCPICSGVIELANGKPDQKQPLVGRCREAPHAHVYSFDRMTMQGYFLGVPCYLNNQS